MYKATFIAGNFFVRYKWNFFAVSLNNRLDFFESNWAFFAGFGMLIICHHMLQMPLSLITVWQMYPLK